MEGVAGRIVDGEVIESDPPRRLVQTWRMLMDPGMAAEGFTRLTYEIEPIDERRHPPHGHPRARGRPTLRRDGRRRARGQGAGGGWAWILSDLKSLLETGAPLAG